MAEAIKYALGHWDELNVFLADGAVAIDNNISEREMNALYSIERTVSSWATLAAAEPLPSWPASLQAAAATI